MHPLLQRQIQRHLGGTDSLAAPGSEACHAFLAAVNEAYEQADRDRKMIEHSLELMSEELNQRNDELSRELDQREQAQQALQQEKQDQAKLIRRLEDTRQQLFYSEKMASIGQLAAGVAHEINNPVGYVQSNLGSLEDYLEDLFALATSLQDAIHTLPPGHPVRQHAEAAQQEYDLAFLQEDVPKLMAESREGVSRVRKIVQDLKDFSHPDEGKFNWTDINPGLRSTLNIVNNELKYKAEVVTDLGDLPPIECNLNQLNQVFLNLLVNAAHAITDRGRIDVVTRQLPESGEVCITIRDTGSGIAPENLPRIFDPFFTTKPVGKGTGLGLSLSYSIIQRHHGRIEVQSEVGSGTEFRIILPVKQPAAA